MERVLLVSDGHARLSSALLLNDLFNVPGVLEALTPTQNYRLGGVLLSAYNYEFTGSGSKENSTDFIPAFERLWATWVAGINPWALPSQRSEDLPPGSYGMDVLQLGEQDHDEWAVPSLGWQLAVGCIIRGVPSALAALLRLSSAPSAKELSTVSAGRLNLSVHLKGNGRWPSSFVYPHGLNATLLGLVLDRQLCRHSPRDGDYNLWKTMGLLEVLWKAGVDPTQPVIRGEIHPLALAQNVTVFDALRSAGALTRPQGGPSDTIAAQVWTIPFLFHERWAALPPVLERWESIAGEQWSDAQAWLWGFVDSFSTMPFCNVSHPSRPFRELLEPVIRVARAGHTSAASLKTADRTWVGGLFQGMAHNFKHEGMLRSRAFLAEDIENLNVAKAWQALPGEAAWGAASICLGMDKHAGVLGRRQRESLLGANAFTAEELGDAVEALAARPGYLLAGLTVWARLQNGLNPHDSLRVLERLFVAALGNDPEGLHSVTSGTSDELDQIEPYWKKAFDELIVQAKGPGLQTGAEVMVLISLGVVMGTTSSIPALPDVPEPIPCAEELIRALEKGLSSDASLASWVRGQSLHNTLPAPLPGRRGPRF